MLKSRKSKEALLMQFECTISVLSFPSSISRLIYIFTYGVSAVWQHCYSSSRRVELWQAWHHSGDYEGQLPWLSYQMWLEKSVSEPSCEDCKRGSTRQFSFTLWISFMTKISCFQCLNMNMQRPRTICLKEHPHWCFNLLSILSFTSFYLYKSICESLLQPVHSP